VCVCVCVVFLQRCVTQSVGQTEKGSMPRRMFDLQLKFRKGGGCKKFDKWWEKKEEKKEVELVLGWRDSEWFMKGL